MMIEEIRIPQTNVNDVFVEIVAINIASGTFVEKGDDIYDIETTKALFTVEATKAGYIYHNLTLNKEYRVGELTCIISQLPLTKEKAEYALAANKSNNNSGEQIGRIISNRATILMEENKIASEDIPGNGSISYVNVLDYLRRRAKEEPAQNLPLCTDSDINDESIIITGDPNLAIIAASFVKKKNLIYLELPTILKLTDDRANELKQLGVLVRQVPKKLNQSFKYVILKPLNKKLYNESCSLIRSLNRESQSCNLIADECIISNNAILGTNIMIAPLAYVGPFTKVSEGCVLLPRACIAHHSLMGPYCSISDGATIGGNVRIGENCLIGLNSSVNSRVLIPDNYILVSGEALINDP